MTTDHRKQDPSSLTSGSGFTLVELIAVIIVVGILGAVAVGRFMGRNAFDSVAYADQSAALLRYAQKVAVAQNRNVWVRVNNNGVALCYQSDCLSGNRVPAPSGANSDSAATRLACANDVNWACEAPPSQVRMTPATTFYFDPLGKPFAAGDAPPTPVSTFAKTDFTITADGAVRTLSVEMETGYVH